MRRRAFVDTVILALVFWSIWSLRFAEVQNVGLWSILAAVGAGAVLMAMRKESWRDIGLCAGGNARFVLSRAGEGHPAPANEIYQLGTAPGQFPDLFLPPGRPRCALFSARSTARHDDGRRRE